MCLFPRENHDNLQNINNCGESFLVMINQNINLINKINGHATPVVRGWNWPIYVTDIDNLNLSSHPLTNYLINNVTLIFDITQFYIVTIKINFLQLIPIFNCFPGLFLYTFTKYKDSITNGSILLAYLVSNITQLYSLCILDSNTISKPVILSSYISRPDGLEIIKTIDIPPLTIQSEPLCLMFTTETALSQFKNITKFSDYIKQTNYMNIYFSCNIPCLFFMLQNPSYINILLNNSNLKLSLFTILKGASYNTFSTFFINYNTFISIIPIITNNLNILLRSDILNLMMSNNYLYNAITNDINNYNNYYTIFTIDFKKNLNIANDAQDDLVLLKYYANNMNNLRLLGLIAAPYYSNFIKIYQSKGDLSYYTNYFI